jgi:hypothetical protein
MAKSQIFLFVACAANVLSKQWNNTGKRSILLKKSFNLDYPELDKTM